MKHLIIILLLFPLFTAAQTISVPDPSMRVIRNDDINLSNTWQDVDFNATTAYTTNKYGINPETGVRFVTYEPATKLFKFGGSYDKNYQLQLSFVTSVTAITTKATLQYRIVIPNGGGAGVPLYAPNPDFDTNPGQADVGDITLFTSAMSSDINPYTLTVGPLIRANGFKIQVRINTGLFIGTATLNSGGLTIASKD